MNQTPAIIFYSQYLMLHAAVRNLKLFHACAIFK